MKRLSKTQEKEKTEHVDKIRSAHEKLIEAISEANTIIVEQRDKIDDLRNDLNEAVGNANGWRDEIHAEQSDYMGERSEKWQEGDNGQAYASWEQEWDNELEEMAEITVETIEPPDFSTHEHIDGLPESPD